MPGIQVIHFRLIKAEDILQRLVLGLVTLLRLDNRHCTLRVIEEIGVKQITVGGHEGSSSVPTPAATIASLMAFTSICIRQAAAPTAMSMLPAFGLGIQDKLTTVFHKIFPLRIADLERARSIRVARLRGQIRNPGFKLSSRYQQLGGDEPV